MIIKSRFKNGSMSDQFFVFICPRDDAFVESVWSTGPQHSSENATLSLCIQFDYRKHGNLITLIVMLCHFTGQHAAEYQ